MLAAGMRSHAIIVALLLLVTGCASSRAWRGGYPSAVVAFNNHGGEAYEGWQFAFRPNGTYVVATWTDILGSNRVWETGTYQKQGNVVQLTSDDGCRYVMFLVSHGWRQALLREAEYAEFSRTRRLPPAALLKTELDR